MERTPDTRGVSIDALSLLIKAGNARREARRLATEAIVSLATKFPRANVRIAPYPLFTLLDTPALEINSARDARDMANHPLEIQGTPEGIIAFAEELKAQLKADALQKRVLGDMTFGPRVPEHLLNHPVRVHPEYPEI